jgi:hypothetical protein
MRIDSNLNGNKILYFRELWDKSLSRQSSHFFSVPHWTQFDTTKFVQIEFRPIQVRGITVEDDLIGANFFSFPKRQWFYLC